MKIKDLNIFRFLRQLRCFVDADPVDNSVTFSKGLYRRLHLLACKEEPKAYVTQLTDTREYAFIINPKGLPEDTPMGKIQVNTKYHTVGFESLVPTVNRILYEYKLPCDRPVRLSVRTRRIRCYDGSYLTAYVLERPSSYGNV